MPDAELASASATKQLHLLERGEVNEGELLELYLDRIGGDDSLVVAPTATAPPNRRGPRCSPKARCHLASNCKNAPVSLTVGI